MWTPPSPSAEGTQALGVRFRLRFPTFILLLLPLSAAASCQRHASAPQVQGQADVVATVNGAAITEADLRLRLKRMSREAELKAEYRANLLEAIVAEELKAQKAAALGFDNDPAYRARMEDLRAEVEAYRRSALAELWDRREIAAKVEVSDEEARNYFEGNLPRIRQEVHVMQILRRDPAAIEAARRAIDGGASFEEVARGLFPNLPAGAPPPWDLGYLTWKQLPEAWVEALAQLKDGQVSPVIRGEGARFWLIKVVGRRENPEVTFEGAKGPIVDQLRGEKLKALMEAGAKALREEAKIVYTKKG